MLRQAFIPIFLFVMTTSASAQILECDDSQGRKEFAAAVPARDSF